MGEPKILGPRWPRKLKQEAFGRSLFRQAVCAEMEASYAALLANLAQDLILDESPVMPYEHPFERVWYYQTTKPQYNMRITLPE